MASSLLPDPLQLWRDAVTKLETDVNALATGSLKSQEVARSLNQFSAVSLGMQQLFEKVMTDYLRRAQLPSRKDFTELTEAVRRVEEKIDRLLPQPSAPRPARTRRPPPAAAALAQPEAEAGNPAPAAAKVRAAKSKPRRNGRRSDG